MFTKTTVTLLGLFVVCEICTLIVFYYQRTVRKLAMRLNIEQSKLVFCYPQWMLVMYKGTFLKFGIILALLILDWRCGLVSLGIFALFFFLSCIIIVPDGGNLIRIRREVKSCGRGTIGINTYQSLVAEIEKGIVATGGDLAKIDAEEKKSSEWGLPLKKQKNLEWAGCKAEINDKTNSQDAIVRTWEKAPVSIKGAIVVIGLVFGGMSLLVGVTVGEMTIILGLVLLFVMAWLVFWIHQILRGKNWTRVFAIVLVLQCIVSSISNVSRGGTFDLSSTVGGACFALVIAVLLFCPEANKWFISWPRGWSYWPVLLIIPVILNLINPQILSDDRDSRQIPKRGETSYKRILERERTPEIKKKTKSTLLAGGREQLQTKSGSPHVGMRRSDSERNLPRDLSQYTTEELEQMLGEEPTAQQAQAQPETAPIAVGGQPAAGDVDLSQYSIEELKSMLGEYGGTSQSIDEKLKQAWTYGDPSGITTHGDDEVAESLMVCVILVPVGIVILLIILIHNIDKAKRKTG